MFHRVALLFALLLASGIATATPRIKLCEALRLAEAFVADHEIPNDDRYLSSVSWHEDYKHPDESQWIISWEPIELVTDHLLVVRIYPDGRITYQDSWA
jgi:hypothetical protein